MIKKKCVAKISCKIIPVNTRGNLEVNPLRVSWRDRVNGTLNCFEICFA